MMKILIEKDKYLELLERSNWMLALEEAGVDNWEGMEHAIAIHKENFPSLDEDIE